MDNSLHVTAIIGDNVKIGKNVKIGPYCIIGNGAIIGDNVHLKSHIVTEGKVTIGDNTTIHPFVSLSYPQTLKYRGEDSEIIIGKNNVLREYVTIQHGTKEDKMVTRIGDNCLFMVGVHVAHNCIVGNNVIFANYVSLAGHVEVDDFAIIGGLSAVQQFCRIGKHAMVGGASAIDKDLIPYGLACNDRANLEGLNLVGMNRRGIDKKQSIEASRIIKNLFGDKSDQLFNQRVKTIKEKYPDNKIIQDIITFLQEDNSRAFCSYSASR